MYFRKPVVRSLFPTWSLLEDYKPYHQLEFFLFAFMIRNHSQQGLSAGKRWPNWFFSISQVFLSPIYLYICL